MRTRSFPITRWFLAIALAGLFLVGIFLLGFFSLPYPNAQSLANRLAADGSLESFTLETFRSLQGTRWLGLLLLVGAITGWLKHRLLETCLARFFEWTRGQGNSFRSDFHSFLKELHIPQQEQRLWGVVSFLTILSLVNKAVLLTQPMGHDEAYTYVAFASRPFFYVIADYHLPNNHIFHTILVFLSTHLFGMAPWAVRLPAILAGVGLVPLMYLAARVHYRPVAGVLAASLVAVWPVLRDYSTHARGYTLVFFFTLALISLSGYVAHHKNRFTWGVWILVAALGMYTIPTMLYSIAACFTWLGLSWLARDVNLAYGRSFWKYLLLAGVAVAGLTILFYAPVLWYSGLKSLAGNSFVQSLAWNEFTASLVARGLLTLQHWQSDIPTWMAILLGVTFLAGNIFHHKLSSSRVPLFAGFILGMAAILLWQRVAPEERVWLFALAFFILGASAGIAGILEFLSRYAPRPERAVLVTSILIAASLAIWSAWNVAADFQRVRSGNTGANELAILFLKDTLTPGEVILTDYVDAPALWYYARLHGLPDKFFFKPGDIQEGAWVLVNTGLGQELGQVIQAAGVRGDELDVDKAALVQEFGKLQAWRIPSK